METQNKKNTKKKGVAEILLILAEAQKDTAPIELSIGNVSQNNQVEHDCIVIKDCPQAILYKLLSFEKELRMEIIKGGLYISSW